MTASPLSLSPASRLACILALSLCAACGSDDEGSKGSGATPEPDSGAPAMATVSGLAAPFDNAATGRIAGATVSVLELPGESVVTGDDGAFSFEVPVGDEVTLVMEHADYPLIQTGTHIVPADGIDDLTFQVPTPAIYDALAAIVAITPDPTRCQMVATVTRREGTILVAGAHGEAGVVITTEPPLPAEHGPIYFNASVIPDRTLTETSDDGGVVYTNVPPGEYVWSGTKAGAELVDVKLKCRAGVLVNASPPRGMNLR